MGRSLGRFITHFRRDFFMPDPNGVDWNLQPGAEERIYERVAPLLLRMETDALNQLPELVYDDIFVDLPPKVQSIYDDLEKDLIVGITDHVIVAANAAAASSKLRQVCCGGIYHTDPLVAGQKKTKRSWTNLHDEKTNALLDLVESLQHSPLLVAYDFEHDLDRLRKAFPKATFACDVPDREFRAMSQRWNHGEIEVLFGHPSSIGLGLNLQDCGNHVCWHSPIWDYTLYDQFNRRVRRPGNKHASVFAHHLIARGTLEELVILSLLRAKETGQEKFFGALLNYARK
jgi:SNF2 family DNA or RNA helicase